MDKASFIHRRKAKYMAQILEAFESGIEPLLADPQASRVKDFKGLVRQRINALATDAAEVCAIDTEVNGAAQELRDSLSATGRP